MGKTRPPSKAALSKRNKRLAHQKQQKTQLTPAQLLHQAASLVQTSEADSALPLAKKALALLESKHNDPAAAELLPALNLLGEINVELGELEAARACFARAAEIDVEGVVDEVLGGGADKFLWLAQLSEDGGSDSVEWYEKGAVVLRRRIKELSAGGGRDQDTEEQTEELRSKLASVLCATAEIYMTDLSFDDDEAERQCNHAVAEALEVAPESWETHQTVANVRISQQRIEEARGHLSKSIALWKDLDPEDDGVPAFPSRISLTRLLMDADMEDEAIEVLERLVQEDDHSVETWYLGGHCLNVIAQKKHQEAGKSIDEKTEEEIADLQKRARRWLMQCLKLYDMLEYEDERLHEHAKEMIKELNAILGEPSADEEAAAEEEDDWEDDDGGDNGGDAEMEDS